MILRGAAAAADAEILLGLEDNRGAGDGRELGAQAGDDLIGRGFALLVGFERKEAAAA